MIFRAERQSDTTLPITFYKEEPSWYIKVLHCKVFPQSERNPLGAVSSGYINLKGLLVSIRRVPRTGNLKSDKYTVENIALYTSSEESPFDESVLFAPDTFDSLVLINSSYY